jgi:uncharacterized protein (DUF2062 family)
VWPNVARRWFRDLRTEGAGRRREAAAVGLGIFVGCLPFYGFHLLLVAALGWLFGLNRLRMYVAANISNPLFAPALILAEIETGALLSRGGFHRLTLDAIRNTDPWIYGTDLLLGSVVLGVTLGAAAAATTYAAIAAGPPLPPHLDEVFRRSADRYLELGVTAWEFARAKLRRDPVYGALLESGLTGGGTLVDIGCGQGLAVVSLVEAVSLAREQGWPPGLPQPPEFERLVGIETRGRIASLSTRALGDAAEIVHARAPQGLPPRIAVALLFDVLHLMPAEDQERLLHEVMKRLEAGGVVLIRDADAAAGWRFRAVKAGNRLKNLFVGNWRQTFYFRSVAEWERLFAAHGWHAVAQPMADGMPFANVMFRLSHRDAVGSLSQPVPQRRSG